MRRMALPLLVLVVACQPSSVRLTDAERTAVIEQVQSAVNGVFEAMELADLDSTMAFITDSAEFAFAEDAHLYLDRDDLIADARPGYARAVRMDFDVDTMSIAVLGPAAAAVSWSGTAVITDTGGHMTHIPMAATWAWAVRDGRWVIIHGHASHDFASQ